MAKKTFRYSIEYCDPNYPKHWHRWNTASSMMMAEKILAEHLKEYPEFTVRIVKEIKTIRRKTMQTCAGSVKPIFSDKP